LDKRQNEQREEESKPEGGDESARGMLKQGSACPLRDRHSQTWVIFTRRKGGSRGEKGDTAQGEWDDSKGGWVKCGQKLSAVT